MFVLNPQNNPYLYQATQKNILTEYSRWVSLSFVKIVVLDHPIWYRIETNQETDQS